MLHWFGWAVVVARSFYDEAYHHMKQRHQAKQAGKGKGKGGKGKGDSAPMRRNGGKEPRRRNGGKEPRSAAASSGKGRGRGYWARAGSKFPGKLTNKQFREKCSRAMLAFKLHSKERAYKYPGEDRLSTAVPADKLQKRKVTTISQVYAADARYTDIVAHAHV
jgi:hypothetical protein